MVIFHSFVVLMDGFPRSSLGLAPYGALLAGADASGGKARQGRAKRGGWRRLCGMF